jgi:hypothetical protein
MNTNQNLFDQTYSQILTGISGTPGTNFQMLGNPINFSWPVVALGQESPAAYQIMSMMPKWSPVGTFQPSDSNFFTAYRRVLTFISFKVDPSKQNDLNNLKDACAKANNTLQQIVVDANSAYLTAKSGGGLIFAAKYPDINAWMAGPGSTYQTQTDTQTAAVNSLSDQYAQFLKDFSTDPDLQEAFALVKTPTGDIGATTAPRGWTKVANSDGSLSWEPVFNIGTTGQDWRAKLSAGTAGGFELTLDASKSSSEAESSWAGGSAGYDAGFWAVNGSGGWQRQTQLDSDASITATIKVQSSTLVPVTPGDWYNGGLMRDLARNTAGNGTSLVPPWIAKGPKGSQCVFGQYGQLSTRVSGLVVVYKPSYSITMQSSTYQSFHEKIEAGGGLRIGPFSFGARGGHETTSVQTTGNKTTLSSTSTSEDPLIIGVTVAFPGIDEA